MESQRNGRLTVYIMHKFGPIGFAMVSALSLSGSASAVTLEVARACDALVAKSFPPRQIGNPAAGSAKGTAKDQREFFQKCIANGGTMNGEAPNANEASRQKQ